MSESPTTHFVCPCNAGPLSFHSLAWCDAVTSEHRYTSENPFFCKHFQIHMREKSPVIKLMSSSPSLDSCQRLLTVFPFPNSSAFSVLNTLNQIQVVCYFTHIYLVFFIYVRVLKQLNHNIYLKGTNTVCFLFLFLRQAHPIAQTSLEHWNLFPQSSKCRHVLSHSAPNNFLRYFKVLD